MSVEKKTITIILIDLKVTNNNLIKMTYEVCPCQTTDGHQGMIY